MRRFKYILTMVVAALMLAADASASALGARADIPKVKWKDGIVRIAISSSLSRKAPNIKSDSDVAAALERAVAAWTAAANIEIQLVPTEKGAVSPAGAVGDGVSLITIAPTAENVLLFSRSGQAESAKTRVFYNRKGSITEADIVLNPFQQFSTDGTFGTFDLESTLVHEIGHLLGLRHSSVLGATMSDTIPKNGAFGVAEVAGRTLSDTDTAAIRDLYGSHASTGGCCGAIAGRITSGEKGVDELRVWAEDNATGRVAAESESEPDGTFRLGGLIHGTYTVLWQKKSGPFASQIGDVGLVKLEPNEQKTLNADIEMVRTPSALSFIGLNYQLSDSSIKLDRGREATVFLGGNALDPAALEVEFNSRHIRVVRGSFELGDFGEGVSALSFRVIVDEEIPSGTYSVFTIHGGTSRSALIGAFTVE